MNDEFARTVGRHLVSQEGKHDRWVLVNRAILVAVIAAILSFGPVLWWAKAHAGPVAEAAADGAKVTLTDEDCKLKDKVTNLPKRATWKEKGKTFEGCFGVHPGGVVMAYFSDGSVVIIPVQMFTAVSGA